MNQRVLKYRTITEHSRNIEKSSPANQYMGMELMYLVDDMWKGVKRFFGLDRLLFLRLQVEHLQSKKFDTVLFTKPLLHLRLTRALHMAIQVHTIIRPLQNSFR